MTVMTLDHHTGAAAPDIAGPAVAPAPAPAGPLTTAWSVALRTLRSSGARPSW